MSCQADGVPHHLHQRAHVLVEELAEQSRLRVGVPGQVAGRGGVQAAFGSAGQLPGAEREEVGALAALDVDHLDVLAGLDLVGPCRGGVHPQVEQRIGQRRRQRALLRPARADPPDLQHQVRGRVVRGHGHRPAGRGHHGGQAPPGGELGPRPGRRPLAEQGHGPRLAGIEPSADQNVRGGHGPEDGGGGVGFGAERAVVLGPAGQHGELAALAAVGVDHGEHVARVEFHRGDGTGVHPVPFQGRVRGQQPRHEQARPFRGHRHREITVISISPADRIPVVTQAPNLALHPAEITPDTCPAEGDRRAGAGRRRPEGLCRVMNRGLLSVNRQRAPAADRAAP